MGLELLVDGEVGVTITGYLKNNVSKFPETIYGIVVTPAAEHLFTVR